MKIQSRPYHDVTDLARMRQLLVAGTQARLPAYYMHPGDLDWETHYPPNEQERRRNLRVWERVGKDGPALEAFAILSLDHESVDLFVQPALYGTSAHEAVMATYLAWAEATAREAGLKKLEPFWVSERDEVMRHLLLAHGFTVQAGRPPELFERSLDAWPAIPVPDGFTVQGVGHLDDGKLRAAVTHGAFRPHDAWEGYWPNYAQFIGSAAYDGERDLFVRSPDGRGASACCIWFDPVNAVGLFEPVATHPDFQGQGLGKVVMAEGLRRMKAAGMRRAIVGFHADNVAARALYTSMGFGPSCSFGTYRKELRSIE